MTAAASQDPGAEPGSGFDLSSWAGLASDLRDSAVDPACLLQALEERLVTLQHGDLAAWQAALRALPPVPHQGELRLDELNRAAPRLGAAVADQAALREQLMAFHPWRKGPLELGGVLIDTEWRSDWKWERIAPALDLQGATVLDVGCGNGYFGWRLLGAGARCVLGIDPSVLFVVQWLAQRHFSGALRNYVLPLRDMDLPPTLGHFDLVMSMGVLYHRRQPTEHLDILHRCLAPGGQLLLETLVVPGAQTLHPPGRYARMRNVHEVPTVDRLMAQLSAAGFRELQLVDLCQTSTDEQRSTPWMTFESLAQCLDPQNPSRTIEGHPAPLRAALSARR